jgi:hypothetical protein
MGSFFRLRLMARGEVWRARDRVPYVGGYAAGRGGFGGEGRGRGLSGCLLGLGLLPLGWLEWMDGWMD